MERLGEGGVDGVEARDWLEKSKEQDMYKYGMDEKCCIA